METGILRLALDRGLAGLQSGLGFDLVGETGNPYAFGVKVIGSGKIARVRGQVDLHQAGRSIQIKLELHLEHRALAEGDCRAAERAVFDFVHELHRLAVGKNLQDAGFQCDFQIAGGKGAESGFTASHE